ncbi:hypothetical protein EV659_103169 [Rhodothalassium salexigens DSM 2132]|uniref:Uncharacterized protein n=1 Tax=Rhodothalassium salexigens DSM 2132 TaxID=1188247 RepID=A0A4R2PL09_RHOSA|nr:hypothetical protein EV659_103169 [Rhodothalassium salexigens DSM 2132]
MPTLTRTLCLCLVLSWSSAATAAAGTAPPPAAEATAFVAGLPDVPRMPGLAEAADARLVFDTPEGAILAATLVGEPGADAVRRFYRRTLPTLGWQRAGADRYARDGQCLTLDIDRAEGVTRLVVSVQPCDG